MRAKHRIQNCQGQFTPIEWITQGVRTLVIKFICVECAAQVEVKPGSSIIV